VTISNGPRFSLALLLALLGAGCHATDGPREDSQTNWLRACQVDAQCGGSLVCLCGACTRVCDSDASCAALPGSSCIAASDARSIALCAGNAPSAAALCIPSCVDGSCAAGQTCMAQICAPLGPPGAKVAIDSNVHFQTLRGLGATVGYAEDEITLHPRKAALYRAMFADLGLSVLRFRNRYGYLGADNLSSAVEIAREAAASSGQSPLLLLTSWTPPQTLKANASLICQGNTATCTLAQAAGGGFDYPGYARYWRASLDAYQKAGLVPDYIGIQNNPDWVPTSAEFAEACKFLPSEGTAPVTVNGATVNVRFPGFNEALTAVLDQFSGLSSPPKVVAPEVTAANLLADYVAALDLSRVDAISHHLYGTDPTAVDPRTLQALDGLSARYERPLFQTEMQADGFGTAVLLHNALTIEGASVYLQTVLTGPASSPYLNPTALITLGPDDFVLEAPYHAMRHFAYFTKPGWVRVAADSSTPELLSSAWLSPAADALSVVLINTSLAPLTTELDPGPWPTSQVVRTVFDGSERSMNLGPLSADHLVPLPARSIVTVAFGE